MSDVVHTLVGMELPLSVVVALDTADELAFMLDRADLADPNQGMWVLAQAEMLDHWASVIPTESGCYPGIADGLREFAAAIPDRTFLRQR